MGLTKYREIVQKGRKWVMDMGWYLDLTTKNTVILLMKWSSHLDSENGLADLGGPPEITFISLKIMLADLDQTTKYL